MDMVQDVRDVGIHLRPVYGIPTSAAVTGAAAASLYIR